MSNFDGLAEGNAIIARLQLNLVGGRVYELYPDDAEIVLSPDGTTIKPFIVVRIGTPVRVMADRTIMGERAQPHRMPVTVLSVAPTVEIARVLNAAVANWLMEWRPTTNASPIIFDGGGLLPSLDRQSKPSRSEAISYMSTVVGMQRDPSDAIPTGA